MSLCVTYKYAFGDEHFVLDNHCMLIPRQDFFSCSQQELRHAFPIMKEYTNPYSRRMLLSAITP